MVVATSADDSRRFPLDRGRDLQSSKIARYRSSTSILGGDQSLFHGRWVALERDEISTVDCVSTRYSKIQDEAAQPIAGDVSLFDGSLVLASHVSHICVKLVTDSQLLDISDCKGYAGSYHGREYSGYLRDTCSSDHQD